MHLCYIDESGTPDVPGNTSHYVLAGVSIPIEKWKYYDQAIDAIKAKYTLQDAEIHVGWMLRPYIEQVKIPNFDKLTQAQRRFQVTQYRNTELLKLQKGKGKRSSYRQIKKNYKQTNNYIHLTLQERQNFITEIATLVSSWGFARLFAECVDKVYFDPTRHPDTIDEQAFEQVVTRFETYLQNVGKADPNCFGLLIHDNNETVARKHTARMKKFHKSGTTWIKLDKIIETPLFVNSELTSMVQIADLCAYALRRYLENGERALFDLIIKRGDSKFRKRVGVRHFSSNTCTCEICRRHSATLPSARISPPPMI